MEPFIRVLEHSNNVLLVSNVCSFINTLVEAPPTLPRRVQIKEELLIQGIQVAFSDVKLKIDEKSFNILDTTYSEAMKLTKQQTCPDDNSINIDDPIQDPNQEKLVYL